MAPRAKKTAIIPSEGQQGSQEGSSPAEVTGDVRGLPGGHNLPNVMYLFLQLMVSHLRFPFLLVLGYFF